MANSAPQAPRAARPGSCSCGQVIFDLSGRTLGEELTCSWCGNRYRFSGGESIEPLGRGAPPSKPVRSTGRPSNKRDPGPPGGMMPMMIFMIVFNAAAIAAVTYAFPKDPVDDLRHAIWDHSFVLARKSIWPEIIGLLVGNLCGFIAWALYAYQIHKKQLAERATK